MKEKFAFKKMLLGAIVGVLLLGSIGTVFASETEINSDTEQLEEVSEADISTEADTTVIVSSTDASTEYPSSDNSADGKEGTAVSTEIIEGSSMDDNSDSSPQTGRVDFPLLLLIGFLGFTVTAICAKKKDAF